jgi:zinc protease
MLYVRVGSRDEETGKSGFATFLRAYDVSRNDKYPEDKYDVVLKSIGASANANT